MEQVLTVLVLVFMASTFYFLEKYKLYKLMYTHEREMSEYYSKEYIKYQNKYDKHNGKH